MKVLLTGTPVGLVIDDDQWPYKILSVNGVAEVDVLDESFSEYADMARRYLGDEGSKAFLQAREQAFGRIGWARISVIPQRARVLDFGGDRLPSAWTRTN